MLPNVLERLAVLILSDSIHTTLITVDFLFFFYFKAYFMHLFKCSFGKSGFIWILCINQLQFHSSFLSFRGQGDLHTNIMSITLAKGNGGKHQHRLRKWKNGCLFTGSHAFIIQFNLGLYSAASSLYYSPQPNTQNWPARWGTELCTDFMRIFA